MHWRSTQNWFAVHQVVAAGLLHSSAIGLYPYAWLTNINYGAASKRDGSVKKTGSTQTEVFLQS
jgi:hypothetical protein